MAEEITNTTKQTPPGGYENAVEAFAIYDTILISKWADGKAQGWFPDYQAFAQRQKHSFFNVRNMGEVGLAYNNMETKDQMPYAFRLYSLGISFAAATGRPAQSYGNPEEQIPPDHNGESDAIFVKDIPQHVGLRLRVRQDEKLLHTCYLAPEGVGPYGIVGGIGGFQDGMAANPASLTSLTQGQPFLDNRWKFPSPIGIPRGATFSVEIELSEYGRDLLSILCGPEEYNFNCGGQDSKQIGACSTIRCSLIGKRGVQQRNELHYG